MSANLRLVIADDHPLFRIGIGYALRAQQFDVVAEANDGVEAVERCLDLKPDAALLDAKMPRLDGIEACRQISSACPKTRIVMLTTFSEPALIESARTAGAVGFLSKETDATHLGQLIRRFVTEPEFRSFPHHSLELPSLSKRELEVLAHLAAGLTNKEMARAMAISPETIKDHLVNLYRKLDAADRISAMAKARALGLV